VRRRVWALYVVGEAGDIQDVVGVMEVSASGCGSVIYIKELVLFVDLKFEILVGRWWLYE